MGGIPFLVSLFSSMAFSLPDLVFKLPKLGADNQLIPASLLNDLLEEAFRASTMGNMQLYSVVVTRDKQMKEKLITKKTGADKQAVLNTLEAFMDTVKESLSREENVYLRGFGSFIVKKRAQKTARNISKNTTIIIPEHNIPAFKPAKTFTLSVKK